MKGFTLTDLILSLFRDKKDWFAVESRTCFTKELCGAVVDEDFGFGIVLPNKYDLTISYGAEHSAVLKAKDGETILIGQTIFESLDAAQVYFEKLSRLCPYSNGYDKLNLWRIVARSRYGAVTLPPEKYSGKYGVLLRTYPEVGCHKPCV